MFNKWKLFQNLLLLVALTFILSGCGATLPDRPSAGRHLAPPESDSPALIPDIVHSPPFIVPPETETKLDLYSAVVLDIPVRELLFSLARDASLNIDIHPDISGTVTLNAVNQTLPQILTRIARQVDIRWHLDPPNLVVEQDKPFLRSYRIDYVNIARQSIGEVSVATSIATTGASGVGESGGGGSSGNNSTTVLSQKSDNLFWETLVSNLSAIIGDNESDAEDSASRSIISNPESGLITVRATVRQHEEIQHFIDLLLRRALHQVLIEATVVEVRLNNQYQAGVDWASLGRGSDRYSIVQSLLGANLSSPPVTTLTIDRSADPDALTATITLLEQFGDLKVLSSPKVMVLNNQTAMLKVVDNKVYFTLDVEITAGTDGQPSTVTYESTVHTVPVGFVMAVTPQISDNEQVTLNVRPTISRIIGYVNDPSPALAEVGVISQVPEIQVREVESILKVVSGQIAVLGGLMQDSLQNSTAGTPVLSRIPVVGNLFSFRDDTATKTELIIFLRPVVIRQASLDGDLTRFRDLLPTSQFIPAPSPYFKASQPQTYSKGF